MDSLGVIFDMDGVLVDSYDAHYESWVVTAKPRGVDFTKHIFVSTFGITAREVIEMSWPGKFAPQQIAQWDADKEQAYREILERNFPEMDGAEELIASLHADGFKLAIGSSGPPENVACVVKCLPSGKLFSGVVNGMDVKLGKPHPDVFLKAAEKLGIAPTRCAVIEDSIHGLTAARAAGAKAIGLTGTSPRQLLETRADLVVDSLRELTPKIIAKLIG